MNWSVTVKSPKETEIKIEMKTNLRFLIFLFMNGTFSYANVGSKFFYPLFILHISKYEKTYDLSIGSTEIKCIKPNTMTKY